MTLILHLLPFRFTSQGFDEIQIKGSVDAATLVFEPQFFSIFIDKLLHQGGFKNDFFLSGFGRG